MESSTVCSSSGHLWVESMLTGFVSYVSPSFWNRGCLFTGSVDAIPVASHSSKSPPTATGPLRLLFHRRAALLFETTSLNRCLWNRFLNWF
jgi:hypothetical protein